MPWTTVKHTGLASFLLLSFLSGFGLWYLPAKYGLITDAGAGANASLRLSPVWDIGELSAVRMLFENTKRYQIDTEEGAREWESLVPEDKGIIYHRDAETGELGKYTISMFHQLRCLNVLRLELIRPTRLETHPPNEPLVKHCLNYIRQMILCRSDLYVENVRDPIGPHAVNVEHVKTCKDWRMVYTAAEAQRLFQSFGDD